MLVGASFQSTQLLLDSTGVGDTFSLHVLAAGIIQGCSVQALEIYLNASPKDDVRTGIQGLVHKRYPVLFYAAERHAVDVVRLLLDHGCDAKRLRCEWSPGVGVRNHEKQIHGAQSRQRGEDATGVRSQPKGSAWRDVGEIS